MTRPGLIRGFRRPGSDTERWRIDRACGLKPCARRARRRRPPKRRPRVPLWSRIVAVADAVPDGHGVVGGVAGAAHVRPRLHRFRCALAAGLAGHAELCRPRRRPVVLDRGAQLEPVRPAGGAPAHRWRRWRWPSCYRSAAAASASIGWPCSCRPSIPDVAYALIWLWMFNPLYGPLNLVLGALGLPQPAWLVARRHRALPALVIMSLFQIGEGFIVLLAGPAAGTRGTATRRG